MGASLLGRAESTDELKTRPIHPSLRGVSATALLGRIFPPRMTTLLQREWDLEAPIDLIDQLISPEASLAIR